jgi:Lon protease-like protein
VTRTLPLFPLSTVLFPAGPLALRIFEPRYIDMVGRCLREGAGFAVVLLVEGQEAGGGMLTTAAVGTEARIVDFDRLKDGLLGLTCIGSGRLRIQRAWREGDGLNMGEVADIGADSSQPVPPDCAHLPAALRRLYADLGPLYAHVPPDWDDAVWVGNRLAELAPLEPAVKQGLLELDDPVERLRYLAPLVSLSGESFHA